MAKLKRDLRKYRHDVISCRLLQTSPRSGRSASEAQRGNGNTGPNHTTSSSLPLSKSRGQCVLMGDFEICDLNQIPFPDYADPQRASHRACRRVYNMRRRSIIPRPITRSTELQRSSLRVATKRRRGFLYTTTWNARCRTTKRRKNASTQCASGSNDCKVEPNISFANSSCSRSAISSRRLTTE